jgi:hypothetical protein
VNPTFLEGGGGFLVGSATGCVTPGVKLGIYFEGGIWGKAEPSLLV